MTPFFLTSKSTHSTRRSLSTHENTSTTSSYATNPYLTRLTEPSRYTSYMSEIRSESLPSWFTSRPTRHAYTSSHAADVAHMSLAYEIERTKVCGYGYSEYQPASYKEVYGRGVRTREREAEYAALLRERKREKEKEEKVRVQRRGDELLYVRDKGWVGESGGWRRTEREVEWVRGRWA